MTAPELAEMVRYMRTHQIEWHQKMTSAARIKVEHSERAVDKAVQQILGDVATDEPVLIETKP